MIIAHGNDAFASRLREGAQPWFYRDKRQIQSRLPEALLLVGVVRSILNVIILKIINGNVFTGDIAA